MTKPNKRILKTSICLAIAALLISFIIIISLHSNKNKEKDYEIPFNYYSTSMNSEYTKYNESIYACPSNNSVTIYYSNGEITNIVENIHEYDEILLENFDVLDMEKSIIENKVHEKGYSMDDIMFKSKVYYVENKKAIPVRIITIKISDTGINANGYICINLCTGEEMDSSIVKEIYS